MGGMDSMDEISLCVPENAERKEAKMLQTWNLMFAISKRRELLDRENHDIGITTFQGVL